MHFMHRYMFFTKPYFFSGELIGFTDLGLANDLHDLDQGHRQLASHIITFMIQGISSDLCFPLAHYATDGITADLLYPLTWDIIMTLEMDLNLHVLFITCDGASPNRKFFSIHGNDHFTPNPFHPGYNVYFISDAPHLIKTARNCLSNSFAHKQSRRLWRGKELSWLHVRDLFDRNQGIYRLCPKLTRSHVYLTPYSVMNVRLAAQVLSSTVADAIEHTNNDAVSETVGFLRLMDKFFDIVNVKDLQESNRKRKPALKPFTEPDDDRLTWLTENFIDYFNEWAHMVENRGQFSKAEKAKMQLSYQTLDGLKLTALSITACIRVILGEGADFVLTRKFNQDKLEQFFGMLRMRGGANDNPNVYMAGHLINNLRFIRTNAFEDVRGNVELQVHRHLDNRPLARRPRPDP